MRTCNAINQSGITRPRQWVQLYLQERMSHVLLRKREINAKLPSVQSTLVRQLSSIAESIKMDLWIYSTWYSIHYSRLLVEMYKGFGILVEKVSVELSWNLNNIWSVPTWRRPSQSSICQQTNILAGGLAQCGWPHHSQIIQKNQVTLVLLFISCPLLSSLNSTSFWSAKLMTC